MLSDVFALFLELTIFRVSTEFSATGDCVAAELVPPEILSVYFHPATLTRCKTRSCYIYTGTHTSMHTHREDIVRVIVV